MSLVEVKNLKFSYGADEILNISNFKVEKGEKLFLYGPSGCGKSTFLEILSGVLSATSGSVEILGQNLSLKAAVERDIFRANHIGYIFQSFNLIPYLSVKENILLPLLLSPEKKQKFNEEKLNSTLESLGILEFVNRNVLQLSTGQQQRVAAARALLCSPDLVLADEPTSALDYDHREKFLNLLFSECDKNKTTLIFVSHDRSLEKMFSRTVSLKEINL